jgi:hypothetical protein
MWTFLIPCKNSKIIFEEKLQIFQDKNSVMCQELFWALQGFFMQQVSLTEGEKQAPPSEWM